MSNRITHHDEGKSEISIYIRMIVNTNNGILIEIGLDNINCWREENIVAKVIFVALTTVPYTCNISMIKKYQKCY